MIIQSAGLNGYSKGTANVPSPTIHNTQPTTTVITTTNSVSYTVQKGDTLSKIAAKYGTTYQKIAADNGISNPNLIYVGQVLRITTNKTVTTQTVTSNKVYYSVKKGDTLSGIARKYNTSVSKLVMLNGIKNANKIYVNQSIRVR